MVEAAGSRERSAANEEKVLWARKKLKTARGDR
jgi:hypothetical protein